MADDLGIGGSFFKGGNKKTASAHDKVPLLSETMALTLSRESPIKAAIVRSAPQAVQTWGLGWAVSGSYVVYPPFRKGGEGGFLQNTPRSAARKMWPAACGV